MNTYGPNGSLTREADTPTITFTRELAADPARVWRALTTREGLEAWLAPTASIDARPDGTISLAFDDDNEVTGVVTRFEPPRVLEHTWVIGDAESVVRYELTPLDGGTRLHLVHRGLPDEMAGGYTPGWHAYLVRLEAVLAGQEPPRWLEVFEAVAPSYGPSCDSEPWN